MIGLPLRLLAREVYNKIVERVGAEHGGAGHRRGEDQAAARRATGSPPSRRCRAISTSRSSPSTKSSSAPISTAATSSPTACCNRRGRDETLLLGAATMRPMVEKLLPGAHILSRPRLSQLDLCGREKTHAPAAPHRHRRLLGRRGLRHRRTDPPPARRRRGGARRAVAAHPQRAGRALPERRRRLPRRHRRHRHGAQPRRRPRRLRGRPQVRRLPVSAGSTRPSSARSPAAPGAPRATAPSAPPAAATRSSPNWCRRSRATASSRCKVLQWRNSELDFASLGALQASLAVVPTEHGPDARADRRRYSGAGTRRRATTTCVRWRSTPRRRRAAVGGLPDPRLSQDFAGRACRTGR